MSRRAKPEAPRTGWPPGLLQDDSRELSRWFASKPDARCRVRAACADIARARLLEPVHPGTPPPQPFY